MFVYFILNSIKTENQAKLEKKFYQKLETESLEILYIRKRNPKDILKVYPKFWVTLNVVPPPRF